MNHIHSFHPIVSNSCTRVLLGSMPGKASLAAQEYYAHPRNHFWQFMEELFGIPSASNYAERCSQLLNNGVAMWDVLKTCTRSSSLDSDILISSAVPNDFDAFFTRFDSIQAIYFNGAAAEQLFEKKVAGGLSGPAAGLPRYRLPSSSPANASIPRPVKLQAWGALQRDGQG